MSEVHKFKKYIVEKVKSAFEIILDVLFQRNCVGCGKEHTSLCKECLSCCEHSRELNLKWAEAVFSYKDPVIRRTLWNIKYRGNTTAIDALGDALYDVIIAKIYEDVLPGNTKTYTLVPIPMSRKNLRERGYNQSELFVRAIHRKDSNKIFTIGADALSKNKWTENQMSIKERRKRKENIRGCFSVKNDDAIKGKEIILIDDIVTTGATLNEARRALLAAGAKRVYAFAVAH